MVASEFATRQRVTDGGVHVVTVKGPADLYTAQELRETLCDAAQASRGALVADLTEVTFLDSSGLGALLAAHQRASRLGGGITVVHDDTQIAQTLRVTGLDAIFDTAETLDEAIERLAD